MPYNLQPESIYNEISSKLADIPWTDVLHSLAILVNSKKSHDQDVLKNAIIRLVKSLGEIFNLEQRIAIIKELKQILDHKEVNHFISQMFLPLQLKGWGKYKGSALMITSYITPP